VASRGVIAFMVFPLIWMTPRALQWAGTFAKIKPRRVYVAIMTVQSFTNLSRLAEVPNYSPIA